MKKFLSLVLSSSMIFSLAGCGSSNESVEDEIEEIIEVEASNKVSLLLNYPIVDTNVLDFYSDIDIISEPSKEDRFYGQDAHYIGNSPSYIDNGDGTVTDEVTGLVWQQEMNEKMSFEEALIYAKECTLGGYDDWRLPTVKELYSLIQYDGISTPLIENKLYINTDFFEQFNDNTTIEEREINSQVWSSTEYVGLTLYGDETVFGVDFVDGKIKGYNKYITTSLMDISGMPPDGEMGERPEGGMPPDGEMGERPEGGMPPDGEMGERPEGGMPQDGEMGERPEGGMSPDGEMGERPQDEIPIMEEIPEGEIPAMGERPEGEMPEGEIPAMGERPEGEMPEGEMPAMGERPEGEIPEGEIPAMGERPEGEMPEGEIPAMGERPEGEMPEGEMPAMGGRPEGEIPEGSQPMGGRPEGEIPVGGQPMGGRPEGEIPVGGQPIEEILIEEDEEDEDIIEVSNIDTMKFIMSDNTNQIVFLNQQTTPIQPRNMEVSENEMEQSMMLQDEKIPNEMYVRLVRGNEAYGENNFVDNIDGTITDLATGLMWEKEDSQYSMDWEEALSYSQNLELAGYDDWRLPDIKELQSIVDYSRSLQTTNSPAISELFEMSTIIDYSGNENYPAFWSSTTHLDGDNPYDMGCYISFGESQGLINDKLLDVHGAGAQRSDPKSGNTEDYPQFYGNQGEVLNVYNYVRSVRTVEIEDLTNTKNLHDEKEEV